jgi:superfamily I DNA/RNA helicase
MPRPVLITGHAGTGKTTLLLDRTATYAAKTLTEDHHRILAITFMHGARHRLNVSLSEHSGCKCFKTLVTTIDSFALKLVNQYRSSLGYRWPVSASASSTTCLEKHFQVHRTFNQVLADAAELLKSKIVRATVSNSYPLIVVDEFQDCVAERLSFVSALADCAQLLVAADPFQQLTGAGGSCPAVDWIMNRPGGLEEKHDLSHVWRTNNDEILNAATALRQNSTAKNPCLMVNVMPAPMAAFRILERLVFGVGAKWTGSTAILSPTNRALDAIMSSVVRQLQNRGLSPLKWHKQFTAEEECSVLCRELGLDGTPVASRSSDAEEILLRTHRFAKLRGLDPVDPELLRRFAERAVNASHAFGHSRSRLVITTIHGAKNQEFDNVIVVWPYGLKDDKELGRRLLYNAITRAKNHCLLLDNRMKLNVPDPVMQLLGERTVFTPSAKKRHPVRRPSITS